MGQVWFLPCGQALCCEETYLTAVITFRFHATGAAFSTNQVIGSVKVDFVL